MIKCSDKRRVWDFFQDRLGIHWSDDFRGCLWIPERFRGELMNMADVGVAIGYNGFIGKTCMMHIVIQDKKCFTRELIRESYDFAYNKCGLVSTLVAIDSVNVASLELCSRLGYKPKSTIIDGALEGDLVLMEMTRADCRWLGERNGKEEWSSGPGFHRSGERAIASEQGNRAPADVR